MLKDLLDSMLLSSNPTTGTPRINDILIEPLTKQQSGEEGTLKFFGNVFDFRSDLLQFGLDKLEIRGFNPLIRNLDTSEH